MRVLLQPRWIALVVVTAILTVTFVSLGCWQLRRLDERSAHNDKVRAAMRGNDRAAASVLSPNKPLLSADDYTGVTATGSYDTSRQLLVRNRALDERPGFFVLTPLITAEGVLLVVRGWIPPSKESARSAPAVPTAPSGTVTVTGRARVGESGSLQEVDLSGVAAIKTINPDKLARTFDEPLLRGYLELVRQTPAPTENLHLVPEPELSMGPHLSYAIQWFSFAAIAVVGCGILLYRASRHTETPAAADRAAELVDADAR